MPRGDRGRGQRRGKAGRALLWHGFGTGNRAHTCAKAAPGTHESGRPRAQEQGKARISLGFTCWGLGLQQRSPPGEALAVAGCFPSAEGPVVLSDLEEASGGGEAKPRVCLSGPTLPAMTRQTLSFQFFCRPSFPPSQLKDNENLEGCRAWLLTPFSIHIDRHKSAFLRGS